MHRSRKQRYAVFLYVLFLGILALAGCQCHEAAVSVLDIEKLETESEQQVDDDPEENLFLISQVSTVSEDAGTSKMENSMQDYANKKLIALTFDDGPNLVTTPDVLDVLERYEIPGTFFLIGRNITDDTQPVLERMVADGCEIASHAWSHQQMNQLTAEEVIDEIQRTSDRIEALVGVRPVFFRPPYIAVNNTMYENIELPFICGTGCTDYDPAVTAQQRTETILRTAQDGGIILLHDFTGNSQTVEALDGIIEGLLEEGYLFVTVSDLFRYKGIDPNQEYVLWNNVLQQ